MNIVTLVRLADNRKCQGFLDWDAMEARNVNFYYWDDDKNGWVSESLGKFKPVPFPPIQPDVVCEAADSNGFEEGAAAI